MISVLLRIVSSFAPVSSGVSQASQLNVCYVEQAISPLADPGLPTLPPHRHDTAGNCAQLRALLAAAF